MNSIIQLEDGTVVSSEINFPNLGTDTVTIDGSDLRAEVYTHGYLCLLRGSTTVGQFRIVDDSSGNWFIYGRTGISVSNVEVARGTDRLRTIGTLLEENK